MLRLAFLLALLQPAPDGGPAEADRLLALGNRLLTTGDPDGAAAAYDGALAAGWTSGALDYNAGTAHLTAGRLGPAVLHLERARRLLPGDAAVAHNLRLAHQAAGEPNGGGLARLVHGLGLCSALVLAAALGTAAAGLWGSPQRRRLAVGLAVLAALVGGVAAAAWRDAAPRGVVLAESALFAAPSPAAEAGPALGPGRVVRLLGEAGDWRRVRASDGAMGWLPGRGAAEI